nr:uncharacterized protein LOC113802358 isoform X2 [Penaeus vannamei]
MVVSLILSSAYQSILTSLLAVPKVEVPVDSLQDLLDYGKIPWSVEHGTSIHQLLDDSSADVYKKINKKIFYVSSSFAERDRMKEERFAILCDFFSMKLIMSDDYGQTGECNYYIAKEVIWSAAMAFAFPKGSHITAHFNKWCNRKYLRVPDGETVETSPLLKTVAASVDVSPGPWTRTSVPSLNCKTALQ